MRRVLAIIAVIILVILAIIIGSRNTQPMTFNYLVAQSELKTSTFMMLCLLVGFGLGLLTLSARYLSLRVKLSLLQRKLSKVERSKAN